MDWRARVPPALLAAFAVAWVALAIDPTYRFGWFLENLLVFAALPVLVLSYWRFRLSNLSYTLIFLFLLLHEVGAHYSYWVPLDWEGMGFERNHYDRVVHAGFGLLLAYPLREALQRALRTGPGWGASLAVGAVLAFSAVYEIVEWLAALVVDPRAAESFVGLQGDLFDPIKDMALAGGGAIVALAVAAALERRRPRTGRRRPAPGAEPPAPNPL